MRSFLICLVIVIAAVGMTDFALGGESYRIPHIAQAPWTTTITAYHPHDSRAGFIFSQWDDDGEKLIDAFPFDVGSNDTTRLVSQIDFDAGGQALIETEDDLMFTVSYQYGATPSKAEFVLSSELATAWVLPNPQEPWFDWFGMALASFSDRDVAAVFRGYSGGDLVADTSATIEPHTKMVRLSTDLWSESQIGYGDVDMLVIETDVPIPPPISITGNQAQDRHLFFTGTRLDQELSFRPLHPTIAWPRGERRLGLNISDSELGFEADFAVAQESGFQMVELNLPWRLIETGPGVYEDPYGIFQSIGFYGDNGIAVSFSLAVVDTVVRATPDYLNAYPYDSPEVIDAFSDLLDFVLGSIPENVTVPSISIGNEVDLVIDGDEWTSYISFFAATADLLRVKAPHIKVGAKTTVMNTIYGDELIQAQTLNAFSDVIMLNLYPQNDQAQVLPPAWIHQAFAELAAAYPDKAIWITEIGYQSGYEHCLSSELKQALFIHELFQAWDAHAEDFPVLILNWLHDQSEDTIAVWEGYYGSSDPAFLEYLSTLGLRHHDGTDKPAWIQLLSDTHLRQW